MACVLALLLAPHGVAGAAARPGDAAVERAAQYAMSRGAVAFMVLHDDTVLVDRQSKDIAPGQLQLLFSGSKSFSCLIAAAAVDDGLVEWDAPVERYIPEWRGRGREGITIRRLLSLDSGLDPASGGGRDSALTLRQSAAAALEAGVVAPPGRRFGYGPYPFLVFSEVIQRVTGQKAGEYLARRVLDAVGARAEWLPTADGRTHLADGALMAPRDWLAVGRLVRDRGRWQGRQVIAADTLGECFRPSPANRHYGVGWWLDLAEVGCEARAAGAPCMVSARGRYSNALHVVPDAGLVVLVIGRTDPHRAREVDPGRLMRLLLASRR